MNTFLLSALAAAVSSGPGILVVSLPILIIFMIIFILLFFIVKYRKKLLKYYKLTLGIVLSVIGSVLTIYCAIQRDTMEHKLASAFGVEEAKTIDALFYIGIAVLIVGAVFIIAHFMKKSIK